MDTFVATWPLMILCLLESVALVWVYGYDKFSCHELMNISLCLISGWVLLVPYDGHVCCHVASDDSVSTGERGPRLSLRLRQVLLPWSYEHLSVCLISGWVLLVPYDGHICCHVASDDSVSPGECVPRLGLRLRQVLLPRSYEHFSVSAFRVGFTGFIWWTHLLPHGLWWFCVYWRVWPSSGSTAMISCLAMILWTFLCVSDFRVGFTGSIWWTRLLPRGLWWFCVSWRVWPSSGSTATTSSLAKILWTFLCVCFQGGFYWFHMMDTFVATWPLMILCLLESVALVWVYGYDKFSCQDLMNISFCVSDFRVGFTGSIWWTRLLPCGLWWFSVYWRVWPSSGSTATTSSLAKILWTFLCVWFQGGFYWFHMMDTFVATWPLMILCLLESVALVWVYGYDKFSCHDLMNIFLCLISGWVLLVPYDGHVCCHVASDDSVSTGECGPRLGLRLRQVLLPWSYEHLSVSDFRVGFTGFIWWTRLLPRGLWWFCVYWRAWPSSGSTATTSSLAMILWTSFSVSEFRVGFTGSIWWTRLLPRGLWWFCVYWRVWPSSGSTATTSSLAKILWTFLSVFLISGWVLLVPYDGHVCCHVASDDSVSPGECVPRLGLRLRQVLLPRYLMNISLCLISGWVLLVSYDGHVCCHVASDDSVSTGECGPRLGLRLWQVLLPWSYEHFSLCFWFQGVFYWFHMMDTFVATWPLMILCLLESVALVWVYGYDKFSCHDLMNISLCVSDFRVCFTGSIWWTRLLPRGLWWFCVSWREWPSSGSTATTSSLAKILWTFFCVWFQGGFYWFHMMDTFVATWPLMILCLLESVALVWVYGYDKFSGDIAMMLGVQPGWYWKVMWKGISPFITAVSTSSHSVSLYYISLPYLSK